MSHSLSSNETKYWSASRSFQKCRSVPGLTITTLPQKPPFGRLLTKRPFFGHSFLNLWVLSLCSQFTFINPGTVNGVFFMVYSTIGVT